MFGFAFKMVKIILGIKKIIESNVWYIIDFTLRIGFIWSWKLNLLILELIPTFKIIVQITLYRCI